MECEVKDDAMRWSVLRRARDRQPSRREAAEGLHVSVKCHLKSKESWPLLLPTTTPLPVVCYTNASMITAI